MFITRSSILEGAFISTHMADFHVSGIPETWNIEKQGQKARDQGRGSGSSSSTRIGCQSLVRGLKHRDRLLARDRGKSDEKFINVMPALEVIKQIAQRNARA